MPVTQTIQLTNLVKSYGDVKAVRGIDFTIHAGETLALLGPNGAGKSTTIDMMLGLSKPDSGSVSIFGATPSDAVRSGAVGGMLQTGTLIQFLSVRELVTMVASLYPHPLNIEDTMKLTSVHEFADRPTNKLSGGQTQRVRMAIALVANPDLLVLDEPTASLDVEGRHDFWMAMRNIASQGKTVVFATHYLEEADAYADRVVLIARGKVVADGSPTEIKARVGGKTIRATLSDVDQSVIGALTGVVNVEQRGESVLITCTDAVASDATLRELIARYPHARDFEVRGAGMDEAFMNLTHDDESSESA